MTHSRLFTPVRSLLGLAALTMALAAGCSNGGSAAAPGGAPSPTTSADAAADFAARSLDVGLRFAQCARDHGDADFPDPVVNEGALVWPNIAKGDIEAAEVHCAQIIRELSTIPQVADPPSAETLQHMRQFAECMRANGAPDWPDPKADGTFPLLGTTLAGMARYSGETVPQHLTDARQACLQFEQEWRIAAS